MNFSFGLGEMIIIFVIFLLLFGPRTLPALGRGLGRGFGELIRDSTGQPDESRVILVLLVALALILVIVRLYQIFG